MSRLTDVPELERVCRELQVALRPYRQIQYGTQYLAERAGERALVVVYRGRKGPIVHVPPQESALAREIEARFEGQRLTEPSWNVWAGSDESGKGDYFGPLVVAAVLVSRQDVPRLRKLGVRDSKALSDARVADLDRAIRGSLPTKTVLLPPRSYNGLHRKLGNVNHLLEWAHAKALRSVIAGRNVEAVVADRFAPGDGLARRLAKHVPQVVVRERAEDDAAVAAASIVARAAFLRGLESLGRKFGMRLPPGAGEPAAAAKQAFVRAFGAARLGEAAKTHFRM